MSVHFRFDWVDAGPSPDVVSQYTMAALSVEAGGKVVTGTLDRQNGTYSRTVVTPLADIAEWLVTNWWHLWYEVVDDGDSGEPSPEFEARHNLAFAGDGFVLPRLRMVPTTGRIRLEWSPYKPQHARIEFLDSGQHRAVEPEFRRKPCATPHGQPETRAAAEFAPGRPALEFCRAGTSWYRSIRRTGTRGRCGRVYAGQAQHPSEEFGVSGWVIRHQMENHDVARIAGY